MTIVADANLGHNQASGAASTIALTTGAAVASNGFIVAIVSWFNNSALLNNLAGGGLTWTIDKQFRSGSINTAICSAQAPAGLASGTTITATFNAATSTARMIGANSFTGVATSSVVDGTPGSASGSGTAFTCGSITTTGADDLIVGTSMRDAGADTTSTPAAGYSEGQDFGAGTGDNTTLVYRILTAAGANNPGGTWLVTGSWASASVAYKAAAGGATTVSGSDSASATDAQTVSVSAPGSQAATATDIGTASVSAPGADAAAGSDSAVAAVSAAGSDAAVGADTAAAAVSATGSDSASATDAGTVSDITGGALPVSGADSATATDAGTVVDLTPAPVEPPTGGGGVLEGEEDVSEVDLHRKTGHDSARGYETERVEEITPRPRGLRVILPRRRSRDVEHRDAAAARDVGRVAVSAQAHDHARASETAMLVDLTAEEEDERLILGLLDVDL